MKKKVIIILSVVVLVIAAVAVILAIGRTDKNINFDETGTFFIAKVVEIKETTMLVEVTYKGNCGVSEGDKISVPTEKIAGVLDNDPSIVTENYVRIEFDSRIMETDPLKLGEVFKIDVTDADGVPVE